MFNNCVDAVIDQYLLEYEDKNQALDYNLWQMISLIKYSCIMLI